MKPEEDVTGVPRGDQPFGPRSQLTLYSLSAHSFEAAAPSLFRAGPKRGFMEDTKEIARRWIDELWNKGNFAVSDELIAPDYLRHDAQLPIRGRESYLDFIREYRRTFPVMEFTIEDLVAEGQKILVRWTARGTLKSGRRGELAGADLLRILDGRIAESWPLFDGLAMLRQIGLLPFIGLVRRLKRIRQP
jgi:predicted ester cyclase